MFTVIILTKERKIIDPSPSVGSSINAYGAYCECFPPETQVIRLQMKLKNSMNKFVKGQPKATQARLKSACLMKQILE